MPVLPALFALAFALASVLGTTVAQANSQDINLTAQVSSYCTLNGSATPAPISQVVPVTGGQPATTPIVITIPVACNTGADFQIGSLGQGMKGPTALTGVSNVIHYTASANGPSLNSLTFESENLLPGDNFIGGMVSSGVPSGDITVTITPKTNPLPLRSGNYADTVRILLITPN